VTRALRRGLLAAATVMLVACGLPVVPSPAIQPVVVVQNQAPVPVEIRWTGTTGGATRIEACTDGEVPVPPGEYVFDVVAGQDRGRLSIDVRQSGIARVIGVGPDGRVGLGTPDRNPTCANS
jgi:hypothetical protein